MPALSRRYRCEIIQKTWQDACYMDRLESGTLKNLLLSSVEMTETFLYLQEVQQITVGYEDRDQWLETVRDDSQKSQPKLDIDDESGAYWMVPLIRKIKLYCVHYPLFVQKLIESNKLEKLDLSELSCAYPWQPELWKLASITPHVCMNYQMLLLAKPMFSRSSKIDVLEITYDFEDFDLAKMMNRIWRLAHFAMNVPNLIFDYARSNYAVRDYFGNLEHAYPAQLQRTRSVTLNNFRTPDNDNLSSLLSHFRRMAPNLEVINLKFSDKLFSYQCPVTMQ